MLEILQAKSMRLNSPQVHFHLRKGVCALQLSAHDSVSCELLAGYVKSMSPSIGNRSARWCKP